jgi:hypothetical protein
MICSSSKWLLTGITDVTTKLAGRLIDGLTYALAIYGLYDRRGYMFYEALLKTAITHNRGTKLFP